MLFNATDFGNSDSVSAIISFNVSVTPTCDLYCLLLIIASNSSATLIICPSIGISFLISP